MIRTIGIAITLLMSWVSPAMSQSGIIEGIVIDSKTKETLVGAQILVQGTNTGTITNFNGEFQLRNLHFGTYDLYISYISYEPLIVEGVQVQQGMSALVNIEMNEVRLEIEGVTVTARRTTHTEIALLSSIRSSETVVSGISAQEIRRSQDSDAAEVVRRIPGVTIMSDRFIIVRGLSERYNPVMLHATLAPSMEADVRSFSFDMIPSSQIDRLLIYKSPSPELPGDFAGGLIRIYTRSIPDYSGFEASYSSNYQHGTTFNSMLVTDRSSLSWLGVGETYFDLPNGFPSDIRAIAFNQTALTEAGRSLRNNWIPIETHAPPDQGFSLTANLRFKSNRVEAGNITTLNYGNSSSINNIHRSDFNAFNHVQQINLPIYAFSDAQYNNDIKIGILHNWGVRFSPDHSIELITLFNHVSSYRYVNRLGDHLDFGFIMNNHAFQQVFRGLYSSQINGEHQIARSTNADWSVAINGSFRNMPDYKQFRSERPINDPDGDYFNIYVPIGGAQPYFMGRFYSQMNENGYAYNVNLRQKLPWINEKSPELRAGFAMDYTERDFRARNIGYTQAVSFNNELRGVPIDSLFHSEHINHFGGIKLDEQSNPQDSYLIDNKLIAYYLSISLPLGKLHVHGGFRLETNNRTLLSATTEGPVNLNRAESNYLPSLNLTYHITNALQIRAAYGKTLNRPEFRENAPFGFFDFDYNYVITGFPHLKTSLIDHYDLRLEYYPSPAEIISLSAFYKDFSNAIERVFLPGAGSGGAKNFSFANADHAKIYGAEIDIRKNLGGLINNHFFSQLFVLINGTWLKSSVDIGSGTRSQGRDTDPRALQGQSPYIVNAGLHYNNISKNLQITLQYNIIGQRIYSGGFRELDGITISYPDVYEMPRHLLDLTISRRMSKNLSIKAGISDIINQSVLLLQDGNQDGKLDRVNDQIIQKYKPGTKVSLGLSYAF